MIALALAAVRAAAAGAPAAAARERPPHIHVLSADAFQRHIEYFNAMEAEGVVNEISNAEAWPWLRDRVPLFECSDPEVEEIYWFRWWALRKHLRRDPQSGRFVFTEFITKPRPISSALGHHFMETRWLRDQSYDDDYVLYWLRGHDGGPQPHLHRYSSWLANAIWRRWRVTADTPFLVSLLDDLVRDFEQWEKEHLGPDGLFWQYDVRDAMEESISGSRTEKNIRPTINSYMYGNARAIEAIARLAGNTSLAERFGARAETLRKQTIAALWDAKAGFFEVRHPDGRLANVREEIGFIPWYFGFPPRDERFAVAWAQLTDPAGFWAPYGLTTAERRHPEFRSHGIGTCEWDGAVWPFATSQTLTALAYFLREYPQQVVTPDDYFDAFLTYVRAQHREGHPYIGEYHDEVNGQWLKGGNPRSHFYHHSTFADLLITGVVGLRPRSDDTLNVQPLLPPRTWRWFCLDGVRYHGHDLTILWDRDGSRYGRGPGLAILVDGEEVARRETLGPLSTNLKSQ